MITTPSMSNTNPKHFSLEVFLQKGVLKKCDANFFLLNYYLAALRPTLVIFKRGSLTHPMLITAILYFRPKGHQEPRNEVGSLSPAERLVGFEPGTFRF